MPSSGRVDATVDAARSPRDFRLATPANWFDLDLNPATRRSSIQTLVEKRSGSHPQTAETRRQLVSLLEQAAKDAAEGGAVFASGRQPQKAISRDSPNGSGIRRMEKQPAT